MDAATRLEELLLLRRQKAITAQEYQREKAKVFRQQAAIAARAAAQRAQRAIEKRREAERKAKELKAIKRKVVSTGSGDSEDDFYAMWKRAFDKGKKRVRLVSRDGLVDVVLSVDRLYRQFRARVYEYLQENSQTPIADTQLGQDLKMFTGTTLPVKKLTQSFKDSKLDHCVFTPIKDKLASLLTEDASAYTKKRLHQRIALLTQYEKEYEKGVPEGKMEEVCKAAGVKLIVDDILGQTICTYNEHGKQASLVLRNTRVNHLDKFVVASDPVEIDEDEMQELFRAVRESGDHWMVSSGNYKQRIPRKLYTSKGVFKVKDELTRRCIEFDKEVNVGAYRINAKQYPALNAFLRESRQVVSFNCSFEEGEADGMLDMEAAYLQDKKCPYYMGLLGTIHQFRSGVFDVDFMKKHLGFYQVLIRPGSGIPWYLAKLGIREGEYHYLHSAEVAAFSDLGLQMEGKVGAWGSRLDLDYPAYMKEKVDMGNKKAQAAYKKWAGRTSMEWTQNEYQFPATPEWASHCKGVYGDDKVEYFDGVMYVYQDAKNLWTSHQILGSIVAYLRVNMILAMSKFKEGDIVRVLCDAIYYRGSTPTLPLFREKEQGADHDDTAFWYRIAYEDYDAPAFGSTKIVNNTLLTGQGGCGKTHAILNDPGFVSVLYVVPCNKLGQKKQQEFTDKHVYYTTIHKLLGIECQSYKSLGKIPNVILLDEITQIDASWIDKVIRMYPQSLVLLSGDIDKDGYWYQCRSGNGIKFSTIWQPKNVDIVTFTTDYRSLDDKLKAEKLVLREKIREVQGHQLASHYMEQFCIDRYKPVKFTRDMWKEGDICISGTNAVSDKLLTMGVVSGYLKKGGWFSETPLRDFVARGSFTTHSFQGETVEDKHVFVFLDDMFEETMVYTAMSRVRRWDQLVFVFVP